MEQLLKLTNAENNEMILVGVESIISVEQVKTNSNPYKGIVSKIRSRGAMIETCRVLETPDEIFNQYKNKTT